MAAIDIEYVELYVTSAPTMVDYFVSSFGFAAIAASRGAATRTQLLRQGAVHLLVTDGPGTSEFLEAHGDGIADVAFSCDDVAGSCEAAVAAGAQVAQSPAGAPVVPGFGAVRHTLYPAAGHGARRLPPGRPWTVRPGPGRSRGRITELDHVAVCLNAGTMLGYADFYHDAFGLTRYSSEYVQVGEQGMESIVIRSASGGITFTMLQPDTSREAGQLDAYLDRNGGPGVQHLAFCADDIVTAVSAYREQGVDFLPTPGSYYEMLLERLPGLRSEIDDLRSTHVLADRDEWGYLLQVFSRSPHPRSTLFYELIQRRGARGFGTRNIRALYEAVERDRLAAQ